MTLETSSTYGYSATTGRLETVSGSRSGTFTYGYETNSGLIKTVTRPGLLETQPALRVTNTWDPARDVLLTKANELVSGESATDVSSITYTVNPIGQRTHATRTGAATNGTEWGYDTLGQLETTDDTNPAADRAYQYDSIGNRLFSEISNTQISNPPQATTTAYAPNLLNQYGNITTGNTSFTPSHDDDGNQKNAQIQPLGSSGLASCVYHWDAENRLTSVTTPAGEVLVSYLYDAQSRLISRSVGVSPTTTTCYVYDGWNRIAEYTVTPGNPNATPPTEPVATLSKTYLWGLDLSGTFQGAGGVGGLLSVSAHDPETGNVTSVHYPTCDGNGNITEYLTAAGAVAAHFEYDPFGNVVASTDATNQFEYRFSTKPIDSTTGLYYYGYRWYDPLAGRWPSRDPIGERGGVNLYEFVRNRPAARIDVLGLMPGFCPCKEGQKPADDFVNKAIRDALAGAATPKDMKEKVKSVLIGGGGGGITGIERIIEDAVNANKIAGERCPCNPKANKAILAANPNTAVSIKLCGQCISSDKLGHFFEEGLIYYEIKNAHGQAYADAFGRWTEGLTPNGMNQALYDFLNGLHWVFFAGRIVPVPPGTSWGAFGDYGLDPKGDASPADLAANRSGQDFWEKLNGGKIDPAKFDICDYVKKEWDQTQNPNVAQDKKPTRPKP